ncbi:MAG: DNA recombination protein RmuC [Nevskiales bacterium]
MTMEIVRDVLIVSLLLGLVWFVARRSVAGYRARAENADSLSRVLEEQGQRYRARELSDAAELSKLNAQLEALQQQLAEARKSTETERERSETLMRALARLREEYRSVKDRLETQQSWVDEQGQRLKAQFGELAAQLLVEKSSTLHQSNNASIDDIVAPLRHQLAEFQARINEVHEVDTRDRAGFSQLLDGFSRTQRQLSGQAEALTRALSVTPGNAGALGTMRLELQLQSAGFEEGRHYLRQAGDQGGNGGECQPPVAMRLPDQTGYLPIDAGLNLNAWEEAATASSAAARDAALEQHVDGLRRHIDLLGSRRYAELADGEKPIPFTLLYVPVEGAALAALDRDPELLGRAHRHKVVVATPGTLFLVVGMVAQLWRVAAQELHAQAVAQASEQLLQRLDEFVDSFGQIGAALDGARQLFEEADARLSTGDGNALAAARRMKLLGSAPGDTQPDANHIAGLLAPDSMPLRLPLEPTPRAG